LPEELQKDPVTRGQFLWMATLGTLVGAVLTIPPVVYVLDPSIKVLLQGHSDVPEEWRLLGSVFEVPANEPTVFRVEFIRRQTYAQGPRKETYALEQSLIEAVLVSWKDGKRPGILKNRGEGNLSETEIDELRQRINVMSNHCAHLGCPVRWIQEYGQMRCPCHGGAYDINGTLKAWPPPRGLYRYAFEIRGDGSLYVKHQLDGTPYVV
jgi:Rieske Fe-S protein